MLDKNGFKRKTYNDLQEDMSDKARELFGEDINVSPRSPLGLILLLFAWFLSLVWELAEKVYNSAFISKSDGVQLDRLGANKGIPRELASEAIVELSFTGTPGYTIPEQTRFSTENDIYFYLVEDVLLDSSGTGVGTAVSVEKGILMNVGPNTITVQAEPLENILTVTNLIAASGGRLTETDSEYRARLISSSAAGGTATEPAIYTALSQTMGVRASNVVINNQLTPDSEGNPGKSVHAYVLGGTREDIAETLFNSVAGGIETVGQESVMVQDISGGIHEVRFDYAVERPIQIVLSLQTNTTFPVDGVKQIQDKLIRQIGGVDSDGTTWIGTGMGQDVIYSRLFSQIYQVPGIEDATLQIGPQGGTLGTSNIVIASQEVAQTNGPLIEVTLS